MININYSAPNLTVVCIDTRDEGGRLYHRYQEAPEEFRQFAELILKMEELYDRLGYPQASLTMRRFNGQEEDAGAAAARLQMDPEVDPEQLIRQRGKLATFLVHVKWRQMATWQGEALWMETGRKLFFESELDFLKILDAAV